MSGRGVKSAAALIAALSVVGLLRFVEANAGAGIPVANSVQQVYTGGTATTPSQAITGYTGDLLTLQAVDVGYTAAEPTLGVGPDGTAFYAASTLDVDTSVVWGVAQTHTLRSTDGGLTWQRVQFGVPATEFSVPPGNADPFVWVDQDTGRIFNIDLYAGCSWANISDDNGDSWTPSPLSCGMPVNDHQTIAAGPPPAGVSTVNYPNVVYYCANQLVQSGCGRSLDGGLVWTPTPGQPFPIVNNNGSCGKLHGHLRTDPDGRVFLPNGGCANPHVAISTDAGDTWTRVKVANIQSALPHTSIASDSAGNLYYMTLGIVSGNPTRYLPFLSISTDHGATWGNPIMVAPPGVNNVNFPVIAAGDPGRIAINFPGTAALNTGTKQAGWNQYVVVSENALDATPTFLSATANDPADPVRRGPCLGRCAGIWDFIDVTISPSGEAWAATADDCLGTCVTTQALTSTHVGRGIAIRQIGGPSLRAS